MKVTTSAPPQGEKVGTPKSLILNVCSHVPTVPTCSNLCVRGAQERSGRSSEKGPERWERGNKQKTARTPVGVNDAGHAVGEDHHRAKLTDHDVWLIHELRAAGVKRREIADKFEISFYTVCEILAHRRRAHTAVGQKARRT